MDVRSETGNSLKDPILQTNNLNFHSLIKALFEKRFEELKKKKNEFTKNSNAVILYPMTDAFMNDTVKVYHYFSIL